jgi:hypothetical protein
MPDNDKSAIRWVRESSIQIISTLIGSGLLLTALSGVYSEFNQPNIHLAITPHYSNDSNYKDTKPKINYYEVLLRNDGKTPATNLTFSMYFFGDIKNYTVFFTDEKVQSMHETKSRGETSLLLGEMPRLAPGAMTIIYTWVNASKYDPYYISATFDQGSASFPVFSPPDVESGRFPNILSGNEGSYVFQQLIIVSSALCIVFFTIAIAHKKIKEIIRIKREGIIHVEKQFTLFTAIPIIIICSILLLYFCEELPKSILVPTIILPPIDVTEGASIHTEITYKNIRYEQGELLAIAVPFWVIVVTARVFLSYLIAKSLISKIYSDDPRWQLSKSSKNILKVACISIMGVPIDLTISLFFIKITYSISPTYLYSIFFILDIVRMLILVLVIPRISLQTNNFFYNTLNAISLLSGIIHISLFFIFLKLFTVDTIQSQFLKEGWYYFFLIVGSCSFIRLVLIAFKEKIGLWSYGGAILSIIVIAMWSIVIYHLTTEKDPILLSGVPIIAVGILMFPLEGAYFFIFRLVRVRKVYHPLLKIDNIVISRDNSSVSAGTYVPLEESMTVSGSLVYNDLNGNTVPIQNSLIIIHNWKKKDISKSNKSDKYKTDNNGKFEIEVNAPSIVENDIKIQANSIGKSIWNIGKSIWNMIFKFEIIVFNSSCSEYHSYNTRVHYVSLNISTCTVYPDGRLEKKTNFQSAEIITFILSIKDKDTKQPISGIDTIQITFTGIGKTIKMLNPTNEKGETIISLESPNIASNGWTYQAYYPGNSKYSKAYSNVGSYSTN